MFEQWSLKERELREKERPDCPRKWPPASWLWDWNWDWRQNQWEADSPAKFTKQPWKLSHCTTQQPASRESFRYLEGLVRIWISVREEIGHLQIFSLNFLSRKLRRETERHCVRSFEFGGSWFGPWVGWERKTWKSGFCVGEARCTI